MSGVIGILLSLLLLMSLAYRDVSVIVLAPLCAMLAVVLDGSLPLLASYTHVFMGSVATFIRDFFPLFLLGAIFGKLMEDSGSAARIAQVISRAVGPQRAVLAVVLSCAVLTYGGVSLFVVVFAVFPLTRTLFIQADIPRRLIPATIALGSFTFTMTALPGSMQIQNQIPSSFFGTTGFAAPGLGILGGLIMFVLGLGWLNARVSRAKSAGEGFGLNPLGLKNEPAAGVTVADVPTPAVWAAFAPVFAAVILSFVLLQFVIPHWKADYLATEQFGKTDLKAVKGNWAAILSMLMTVLLTIVLHYRSTDRVKSVLTAGAGSSLLPVFNTASEFGYGATIKALAGFAIVQKFVTGIAPSSPLVSEAIAVNALAGISGSASGGLSIALKALGETYYKRGLEAGLSPEVLHRVASMSCGGFDSLPHNGALITLLLICGVPHRQGYLDVAVVTILCPVLATAVVVAVASSGL